VNEKSFHAHIYGATGHAASRRISEAGRQEIRDDLVLQREHYARRGDHKRVAEIDIQLESMA